MHLVGYPVMILLVEMKFLLFLKVTTPRQPLVVSAVRNKLFIIGGWKDNIIYDIDVLH